MIQRQQLQQRRFEVDQQRRLEVEHRVDQDESVGQAISRVAEAGQHLVLDRLDLLKVEAKAAVDEKVTAATEAGKALGLVAVAAIVLRAGWVTLMVALGFVLAGVIGVPGALAIIGGVHVVAALIMFGVAAKKRRTAGKAAAGELREGRAPAAAHEPVGARA